MRRSLIFLISLAFLAVGACSAPTNSDNMKLTHIVTDDARVLNKDEKGILLEYLKTVKEQRKITVLVLTIKQLPAGEKIDMFSTKIFNNTGIGKEDKGILIVLSMKEKVYRLDIGRGLEGEYPDQIVAAAVKSAFPFFRERKMGEGIKVSLQTLMKEI